VGQAHRLSLTTESPTGALEFVDTLEHELDRILITQKVARFPSAFRQVIEFDELVEELQRCVVVNQLSLHSFDVACGVTWMLA
jgi:hypothetical protein